MDAVCGIFEFMTMGSSSKTALVSKQGLTQEQIFFYSLMENLMFYNTSKFQVGGGLGSAIIVDLVTRGEILKFQLSKRPLGP